MSTAHGDENDEDQYWHDDQNWEEDYDEEYEEEWQEQEDHPEAPNPAEREHDPWQTERGDPWTQTSSSSSAGALSDDHVCICIRPLFCLDVSCSACMPTCASNDDIAVTDLVKKGKKKLAAALGRKYRYSCLVLRQHA